MKKGREYFNKKGELTSAQIIGIVLALIGFVIIVLFIFLQVDLPGYTEDELCRLSVLTRATSPEKAKSILPLNCETKKICLTTGNDCEEAFAGENFDKISLPSSRDKIKEKIEEVTVKAMWNCWNMMGEGKLDLFGSWWEEIGLKGKEPICIVCSRIALDFSNLDKEDPRTKVEIDLQKYMESHQIPGRSETYLQKFTGGQVANFPLVQKDVYKNKLEGEFETDNEKIKKHKGSEVIIVFSQVKIKNITETLTNLGKTGLIFAAGIYMTPGVGGLAKKLVFTKVGLILMAVVGVGTAGYATYNSIQSQNAAAGYCGRFATNNVEEEVSGCSMVQVVPYTIGNVNVLCPNIQGRT